MFNDITFLMSATALFIFFLLSSLARPPDATADFLRKMPVSSRVLFGIIKIAMWQFLHAWGFSAWGVTGALFVCFLFAFLVIVGLVAAWSAYFKRTRQ